MESLISSTLHALVSKFDQPKRLPVNKQQDDKEVANTSLLHDYYNDESDYDFGTLNAGDDSISERIISQRHKYHDILNTSSPKRQPQAEHRKPILTRRQQIHRTPQKFTLNGYVQKSRAPVNGEREKIYDFINVDQMMGSLKDIEELIRDPNINYEDFKQKYIQSSISLIDSINDKEQLKDLNGLQAYKKEKDQDTIRFEKQLHQRQIAMEIISMCYQIFRITMELVSPIVVQFVLVFKQTMANELVVKILDAFGQILLLILTFVLDSLRSFQQKSKKPKKKV